MYSTRLRAFYTPLIAFLPNLGLAVVLLVGGRQVIDGIAQLGDFTAFYTYLLMLMSPMRMLGIALGMAQRAVASGQPRVRDPRPRAADRPSPPDAPAAAAGRRPGRAARRHASPTTAATPALRGVDLEVAAGRDGRARRADRAPGKTTWSRCSPRLYDPTRGRGARSTAPTCASVDVASLRAQIALRPRRRLPVLGHRARRTSPTRGPDATRRRSSSPPRGRRRTFIERLPTATRRWSASAA